MKIKREYGVDEKTGFRSSKPIMDGLQGKPAKINEYGEYVCETEEQCAYYLSQGYKACLESDKE